MTNYICGQNSISERHFVFLRKAAQLFSPFIRNLLGSDPLDTVQRFCTTTSSRPLPARRERRQKAIAGWTPQVVNWCTIKMQSWRDTNADRTVLVEGKHKCSRIVSWCASLAVFARFSDFWNRRLRCAILDVEWRNLYTRACPRILSSACVILPLAVLCMDHLDRVEGVICTEVMS